MREFWVYTAMRLLLLIATFIAVTLIWSLFTDGDVPTFWAVLVAFVISGVLSFFLLNGPRRAFAVRVESRAAKAADKFEERRSREDTD